MPEQSAGIHAQVEAGKQLFATGCVNCHGSAGKGAIGPALADRNLSPELIQNTVLNGRVGTPMPPFKSELDSKSLAEVVAYVQWLTSGGQLPTAVVSIESSVGSSGSSSSPSTKPLAIGQDAGIPARGAAIFFDPTRIYSCRSCHSFAEKGGPVGPDLMTLHKSPMDIYQSISQPKVMAREFPAMMLEARDGTRLQGIKGEETENAIQVFDVSSVPPVRRLMLKPNIKEITEIKSVGIYDHTALPFLKQDRLDLSAYLGKSDPSAPGK